jgi:type IV pilus assembly protein PilE
MKQRASYMNSTSHSAGDRMQPMTMAARGFTLVEVMIVVAIVAILSAIAYPSYTEYVRRGQRAEARTQLLEAAQFMQRFYSANDRYDQTRAGAAVALPATLQVSPPTGTVRYNIAVNATPTAYTLQAVPAGSMAGDRCGTITLDSNGRRNVDGASSPAAECWR